MKSCVLLLPFVALAPLAHAGVRMQTGADAIFLAPLEKPDPAAQRLPAAEGLVAPTVAQVSPDEMVAVSASQIVASPTGVVSATAVAKPKAVLGEVAQELCARAMLTTMQIAMVSYQQEANPKALKLALAATAAVGELEDNRWPNLTAFDATLRHLPNTLPLVKEMTETGTAAHNLCGAPSMETPRKGSRLPIARPE